MDDLEALEQKLFGGENGEALRSLSETEEAKRLGRKLSASQAEQAVRSGDIAQMRALLQTLLSTDEGKALAEKLAGLGGKK